MHCCHAKQAHPEESTKDHMSVGESFGDRGSVRREMRQQFARENEIRTPADTISSRCSNGTQTATAVKRIPQNIVPQ